MVEILKYRYKGEALKETAEVPIKKVKTGKEEEETKKLDIYLPDNDVVLAVNLALQLKRPLLLMGEPGCGKTRLAEAVAYELHRKDMYSHYFRWDIKSTSKAKDGIYSYDAIKRLYHANLAKKEDKNVENKDDYIDKEGPLALAFTKDQNPKYPDRPNILLIDEIDKADIDFPNDILLEVEEKVFKIPELGKDGLIEAKSDVLIIVTSNQEKELPPAFLRRCIYCYIEFPKEERLKEIVSKHTSSLSEDRINRAFEIFYERREELAGTEKKPSTSELIDWFQMLDVYQVIEKKEIGKRSVIENQIVEQLKWLDNKEEAKIPFKHVLLKTKMAFLESKREEQLEEEND